MVAPLIIELGRQRQVDLCEDNFVYRANARTVSKATEKNMSQKTRERQTEAERDTHTHIHRERQTDRKKGMRKFCLPGRCSAYPL